MTEIDILEGIYAAQVASLFAGVVKNSVLPRWRSAATRHVYTIYALVACFTFKRSKWVPTKSGLHAQTIIVETMCSIVVMHYLSIKSCM